MKLLNFMVISMIAQATNAFGKGDQNLKGYVPDEKTAVKVAEAVLTPIYGEEQIAKEQPLKAQLEGDVWIVQGTLAPDMLGGVALIKIKKATGEVLKVTHGK